jgi:hypothetical protein
MTYPVHYREGSLDANDQYGVKRLIESSGADPVIACRQGTYSVEVDTIGQKEWGEILQLFCDSSPMQTWCCGSLRWGEKRLSHLILKKDGKIIAAAQAIVFKPAMLPVGFAHIRWGPCWQLRGQAKDLETFRRMVQALHHAYVVERRLLLQIIPNAVDDGPGKLRTVLEGEGFQKDPYERPHRTLIMDLSHPLDELRRSLKKRWRHNLVLAEQNSLEISSGADDQIFQDLMTLQTQTETRIRKRWGCMDDRGYLGQIQRSLPPSLKMMCMICRHNGELASGIAVWKAGNTATLVLAPTGNQGLKLRSSYLLQWRMLEWLKSMNVHWYDLSYINPKSNAGLYQFKSGLGGKMGQELEYVGAYHGGNYRLTRFSVQAIERSRMTLIKLRRTLATGRSRRAELS